MKEINDLIRKYELKPKGYIKKDNIIIVNTKDNNYIVKKKKNNNDIYNYLNSRSFRYYPKILVDDSNYQIFEYINSIETPEEQKMLDMINLVSLLHNKTTFYKEIDDYDYKKIYEDIIGNIEYLDSYYTDIITIIESKVYMSPSEFLIATNINRFYKAIYYAKEELEEWLKIIEQKKKQRFVVLHNNLRMEHFIRNSNSFLISWDKATIDIPIFDLYKLYKRYFMNFDFDSIFIEYEKNYPLLKEERKLLFILIALPDKIELTKTEYENTKIVMNEIDYLIKTEKLIKEYSKTKKEYEHNK